MVDWFEVSVTASYPNENVLPLQHTRLHISQGTEAGQVGGYMEST